MNRHWMLLSFVLVACGGGGGDRPHCGALVGSCESADGLTCAEYGGNVDGPASQDACEQSGGIWSTGGCDTAGFVAGCQYDVAGTCAIQWYPSGAYTSSQVQDFCAQGGGTFLP